MTLAQRTARSIGWTSGASILGMFVLFARSIILARLLPVEIFGVYAGAGVAVQLPSIVAEMGFGAAFIHRSDETENESDAAATYLTLSLITRLIMLIVLVGFAFLFLHGADQLAVIVIALSNAVVIFIAPHRLILMRRVVHRRIASADIANDVLTSIFAVWLATQRQDLWPLLITNIVTSAVVIVMFGFWKPVWRLRFRWHPPANRYFIDYGIKNLSAGLLQTVLDRLDDLWTRLFLGEYAMGLYSRAYNFAIYPRMILADPINAIAIGAYAELKDDRHQRSQAFFRINALLIRSGFLLAGVIALVAPEFIRTVLGDKWLPFLPAFRLMLLFTLLEPLKHTIALLFIAMGQPEKVVRIRLIQVGVMLIGLITLSRPFNIVGVALAVDIMLIVGIVQLLWHARSIVDLSLRQLFLTPSLGLLGAFLAVRLFSGWMAVDENWLHRWAAGHLIGATGWIGRTWGWLAENSADLLNGVYKSTIFLLVYLVIFAILERDQLGKMADLVMKRTRSA